MAENLDLPKFKLLPMNEIMPEPYCDCWDGDNETEPGDPDCGCGEELDVVKWRWEAGRHLPLWVELVEDRKQVVFHPLYSAGTAVARGNAALKHNMHYYWEIKMLTQPYGTDIMVGIGTKAVADTLGDYATYLGSNENSFGLSYSGAICQNGVVIDDCPGFCKGTIIGVMVDMFHGTLEFYLNRVPQGISFTGLRHDKTLYPMISSTAAMSSMRLTYASSWQHSLLINAAKVLAASVTGQHLLQNMPPGLAREIESDFWIALPSAGRVLEGDLSQRYIRHRIRARRF